MRLQIVNMVAIVKLSTPLDLGTLASALKGSEFGTSGGKWLKMRLQPENYYIAFYKSGKFLITGAKSMQEVDSIARRS
jgi:transcription initiation factor TFIID TATA-box-binding protein